MSAHLTEEEQLEALKRWWKENGKNTVIAVVVAVSGYFGFEFWQEQTRVADELASEQYQILVEAVIPAPGTVLSEAQRATAESLAADLKQNAGSGFYGQSAALYMAKLAVDTGDLKTAQSELEWLLEQQPEQAMALVARLRLARILAAAGHYDSALNSLQGTDLAGFSARYAEVRGDILVAKGDLEAARNAYQLAQQSLTERDYEMRSALQVKLDDLAVATDVTEPAAVPENTEDDAA